MNKGSTLVFEAIIKMKQFLRHRERLSLAPQLWITLSQVSNLEDESHFFSLKTHLKASNLSLNMCNKCETKT
jgi:hypothetical protein